MWVYVYVRCDRVWDLGEDDEREGVEVELTVPTERTCGSAGGIHHTSCIYIHTCIHLSVHNCAFLFPYLGVCLPHNDLLAFQPEALLEELDLFYHNLIFVILAACWWSSSVDDAAMTRQKNEKEPWHGMMM